MTAPGHPPSVDRTTYERIVAIIADSADCDPKSVRPESRFAELIPNDSMECVEIILGLESSFGVHITDEEAIAMRTVQDVLDFIGSRPESLLLRPVGRPDQGIVLLRPAAGDDGTLLRASTEAAGGCMDGHGGPSHHGSRP